MEARPFAGRKAGFQRFLLFFVLSISQGVAAETVVTLCWQVGALCYNAADIDISARQKLQAEPLK